MCIAGGDKTLISLIFHANGLLKFLLFPANHCTCIFLKVLIYTLL